MKIVKRIGLLVLFSLAGAILMYLYSSASLRGSFVKWESLGKPPNKAIKVVAPGYVQTESDDIYQSVHKPGCNDNCWAISDNTPPNSEYWLPLNNCTDLPPLDNYVDSKAVCEYWGVGISLTVYAVDKDGFVYSWDHRLGEGDYMFDSIAPFIGAIAGFIIGLFVLLVILFSDLLKWLQKRAQESSIAENI
jgi:hypothetical protein